MSELNLPPSWAMTSLEQMSWIEMGQSPESSSYNSEGDGLPFFQGKAEFQAIFPEIRKWCTAPGKIVESGDILLSIRAPVGPTNISPTRSCIGRGLAGLRSEDGISQKYFFYFLRSIEQWLSLQGAGSTFAAVNGQFVRNIEIPIAPSAEQTRIVAKLEELLSDLDAGVAELKAAQKKLVQYRQSLLKAAVEGALTAEWREAQRKRHSTPLSPRGRGAGGEGAQALNTRQAVWFRNRARQLRQEQTPMEQWLWQHLRAKRFSGFKFRRQQPIGRYIVDFVCFAQRLIIELDGSQHADAQEKDAARDDWLHAEGFRVLRFWNNALQQHADAVLESIWCALQDPPLPNPSPARGEGLQNSVGGWMASRPNLSPARGEGLETETGAHLLARILTERRARWEAKQLARFAEQGKTPPRDWQKKYPEPVQPDTTDLPELPEGWVWATLDMLGEIASGVAKGTKRGPEIKVHQVPYLRVANVQRGYLDLQEVKTILATQRDIAELTLQSGDVLFNEGGDRDKLGRGWVWRDEVANCIHQNHVFRMRPYLPEVLPELVSHHGNTFGKTWFQNAGKQTTNLASINLTMLRMFPVPLGPAQEQRELLNLLEVQLEHINQQEQTLELALKQSTAQRQNILRAAFAGQLVPQDPNDEPASVLLDRIRAERAQRDAVKNPRGRRKSIEG